MSDSVKAKYANDDTKLLSLANVFEDTSDEFWFWYLSGLENAVEGSNGTRHPDPPRVLIRQTDEKIGHLSLSQTFEFYRLGKNQLARLQKPLNLDTKVLVFDSGAGFLARMLLKDVLPENIVAVDSKSEAAQIQQIHTSEFEFMQISAGPPIALFEDHSFDLIFVPEKLLVSLEKEAKAWLVEFARLLNPGGVVLALTRPREAISNYIELRDTTLARLITSEDSTQFTEVDKAWHDFDKGHYCSHSLTGDASVSGKSCVSLAYLKKNAEDMFPKIDMIDFKEHHRFLKNIAVLIKAEVLSDDEKDVTKSSTSSQSELEWTGERLVTSLRGPIATEHLHRYAIATEFVENKVVLDAACGEGFGTALLAKTAQHVIGVDISEQAIAHAQEKYTQSNCEFKTGSVAALPIEDQSIDVVVSFETIEHVVEQEIFVSEIKRCLKPNGTLIISSPDRDAYNTMNPEPNPFHLHEMSYNEFISLLQQQFKHLAIGKQRMLYQGSFIAAESSKTVVKPTRYTGDFEKTEHDADGVEGIYSIAICSDIVLPEMPFGIFEALPGIVAESDVDLAISQNRLLTQMKKSKALERNIHLRSEVIDGLSRWYQNSREALGEAQTATAQLEKQKAKLEFQLEILERNFEESKLENEDLKDDGTRLRAQRQGHKLQIHGLLSRLNSMRTNLILNRNLVHGPRGAIAALIKASIRKIAQRYRQLEIKTTLPSRNPLRLFTHIQKSLLKKFLNRWNTRKRLLHCISNSGLFDERYYKEQSPEVDFTRVNPVVHFICTGVYAGKNPNAFFDVRYYLEQNPDVADLGMNPLVHFVLYGAREERDPSPDFITEYYLAKNPDIAQSELAPYMHFYFYGRHEDREYKPIVINGIVQEAIPVVSSKIVERTFTDDCKVEADPEQFNQRRNQMEWRNRESAHPENIKCIAFYLPQYHPIPENDEWWGTGFTEWENVVKARPMYEGHIQPHLPADLGFYDLRISEIREKQAAMAKAFNIHGFCYYYYWFNGKRLLEHPLEEVLSSGEPDFPFCICWANENWTRAWDGQDNAVLMEQEHSLESDIDFINDVIPMLKDKRYIRYKGKPILLIYRGDKLKDPMKTTEAWRKRCQEEGVGEIHLCAIKFAFFEDPRPWGFDAFVEFPPNTFCAPNVAAHIPGLHPRFTGRISEYDAMIKHSLDFPETEYLYHRGLMAMWDNTPRRRYQSILFHGANPDTYGHWLSGLLAKAPAKEETLLFINAWNEWGEGAHLEPDQAHGYAFLETTSQVLEEYAQKKESSEHGHKNSDEEPLQESQKSVVKQVSENTTEGAELAILVHDALCYGVQFLALSIARTLHEEYKQQPYIILKTGGDLEPEFAKYGKVLNLSQHQSQTSALTQVTRHLVEAGVTKVIACTIAVGDVALYLKQQGMEVVSLVNELPTTIESGGYQDVAYQSIRAADTFVFACNYVRDAFVQHFKLNVKGKIVRPQGVVVNNTYLQDKQAAKRDIIKKHKLSAKSKIVLSCASGGMRKGPDIFLAVAKQVLQQKDIGDVHFIWVGDLQVEVRAWFMHDLERINGEQHVHFAGFQREWAKYMAASDIYLLPSREDPFPNVMLSAMDAGMPVVAFQESGGAPELLDSKTGLVVPYLDTVAMSEAVIGLLRDDRKRQSMGQHAETLMKTKYSSVDYVGDLLSYFSLESTKSKQ
jgi:ubiquinone/menaquinone biosynthesis C-methylase UbiE/glycosyltransferase involved in cell wall biosynthesis